MASQIAWGAWMTAFARPSAKPAAESSFGMMNQRASIAGIAIPISASAAPRVPGSPGATITLTTQAATAARATMQTASGRSRHTVRRSTTEMRGIGLFPQEARIGRAETPLQLGAHLLGDAHRIDAVADDLRADEDDQLGALFGPVGVSEQVADRQLVDDRKAGALLVGALADQAGQQHGLAA